MRISLDKEKKPLTSSRSVFTTTVPILMYKNNNNDG